jgi:hypothetical protein
MTAEDFAREFHPEVARRIYDVAEKVRRRVVPELRTREVIDWLRDLTSADSLREILLSDDDLVSSDPAATQRRETFLARKTMLERPQLSFNDALAFVRANLS